MKLDFMKTAKIWVTISVIVTLAGLGSLIFQGMNLGIDFTGGALLDLSFNKQYTQAEVADLVRQHFKTEPAPPQVVESQKEGI
jgi:preprotein translocase subunit SecF